MSTKPDRKLANIMLAYLERTTGIRRDLLVKQIKDHNETERN